MNEVFAPHENIVQFTEEAKWELKKFLVHEGTQNLFKFRKYLYEIFITPQDTKEEEYFEQCLRQLLKQPVIIEQKENNTKSIITDQTIIKFQALWRMQSEMESRWIALRFFTGGRFNSPTLSYGPNLKHHRSQG